MVQRIVKQVTTCTKQLPPNYSSEQVHRPFLLKKKTTRSKKQPVATDAERPGVSTIAYPTSLIQDALVIHVSIHSGLFVDNCWIDGDRKTGKGEIENEKTRVSFIGREEYFIIYNLGGAKPCIGKYRDVIHFVRIPKS